MALKPLTRSRLAPWSALVAAALALTLYQQAASGMLRYDCRLGGATSGILGGVIALLLIGAGCWISWASVRDVDPVEPTQTARRFVAHLSLMFAGLLSVAVLWQVLATFTVPPCP